jgi:hypothetical protein
MKDDKLWKAFSVYIRVRDADSNGYCRCITSGKLVHWTECDAGHFISRRHMATKYDEQNVHAQGRGDNRFRSGEQLIYAKAIDKKYGQGTADRILARSRGTRKFEQFEIESLTKHYQAEASRLKKEKGL